MNGIQSPFSKNLDLMNKTAIVSLSAIFAPFLCAQMAVAQDSAYSDVVLEQDLDITQAEQNAPSAAEETGIQDAYVVTGSRLRRSEASSVPLQVFTTDDIEDFVPPIWQRLWSNCRVLMRVSP